MNRAQYDELFNFMWNIANDVLVNVFDKGDYKKIILPMIVLRRLDLLLEPTKEAVLKEKEKNKNSKLKNREGIERIYFNITGYPFYNTSKFTMKQVIADTNQTRIKRNFIEYLDGFSTDVQDIIDKFRFKQSVENLHEVERLRTIIEKFTDDSINLGIKPVLNLDGSVMLPGLDNHTMGTLFEQLLRKFNEEHSVTEAGEHFTPRDYVHLLADLAVIPIADKLEDKIYHIYDGACGTGGILSICEQRIHELAEEKGKNIKIDLFGQELQPETYAICKADLMLSSKDINFTYLNPYTKETSPRIFCGSTISNDGHSNMTFDFCISNPPFGMPWKEDLKAWGIKETEKNKITDERFVKRDKNKKYSKKDGLITFVPNIGDPQMLFLANNLSRMKKTTSLGTRIVEVHNGSSLFTGNPGGGESNLRRYIIENDYLEAIIAMPENNFYNTGIGTFIWVITNRKEKHRKGKVQLIDATEIKTPLRKNLGEKNCQTAKNDREKILKLLTDFKETEQSKIFKNEEFGFYEVTVERPLRLRVNPNADITIGKLKQSEIEKCKMAMANVPETIPLNDWNKYQKALGLTKTLSKKLRNLITVIDENAIAVKGEADTNLRDTEQIPLLYEGGIEAFMEKEVLPYAPDAYIDEKNIKVGYELSFTKYFYKPIKLRTLEEISSDILDLEKETDGLLNEILEI